MLLTRKNFDHAALLATVAEEFQKSTETLDLPVISKDISHADCLMSALAMFSLKFPSLLKFDKTCNDDKALRHNIHQLYHVAHVPCDTTMRERLDVIHYDVTRTAFTRIFARLQRGNILDDFRFMEKYYLVSLDGTGYFSSAKVHCEQCCVKESKKGEKTYYHQMLSAALVHPDQKVVFPFAPEPIMNSDGSEKNDCERNAAKRWLDDFRREHPHLPVVIIADGLFANSPFLKLLAEYDMRYIIVCKEDDHTYLTDWVKTASSEDAPSMMQEEDGITRHYQWMDKVPLNGSTTLEVSVLRLKETKRKHKKKTDETITTSWMWVTDLPLTKESISTIMKGGRARWKIENETFNTLKNQGYNFEHNYGHGNQYLSTLLAHLMLLAFFIDQCLQILDKSFIAAWKRMGSRIALWERVRSLFIVFRLTSFEQLYQAILHPPDIAL